MLEHANERPWNLAPLASWKIYLYISGKNNKIVTVAASLEGDLGLGIKFKESNIFLYLGESRSKGDHYKNTKSICNFQTKREEKRERIKRIQLILFR